MMSPRLLLLAVLAVLAMEVASNPHGKMGTNRFQQMRRGPPPVTPDTSRALEVGWITQKLNHFDPLDDRTFQQRYFYSADVYQPGGPVFLFISGEWESNGYQVTSTFIGDLAAQHGGFMIDLEHRFYGQTRPVPDTTTSNLQFLNDDQALEDAAFFAQTMMSDPTFNLTGPWIVVGGSYSANLAAWARALYPHLFYAAYASSGPVLAQLDFYAYFEVVDEALRTSSAECPVIVENAMNELDVLVAAGDATTITNLFNFCETVNLANPDDVMNVYTTVAYYFAGEVQYARNGNLDALCTRLSEGQATPLETVAEIIREAYRPFCLWSVNQEILDFYRDDVQWSNDFSRQWFYQACVDYGYWQSLSSPNQPFGQVAPVEFSLLWCSTVYGPEFTKELNQAGIDRTNLQFGGLTPDVTHVLYSHGSLDPWHASGIQSDLNADSPVVMIDGESHCRDIGTPSASDSQALKDARVTISQILAGWLASAPKRH